MTFRLSTYLALAMTVGAIGLLAVSGSLAFAYVLACAAVLAPYHLITVRPHLRYQLIVVAGTIWMTHIVRAPLMATIPELFTYPRIGLPGHGVLLQTLLGVALNGGLVMTGLALGTPRSRTAHAASRDERLTGSLLLGARHLIIVLLFFNLAFQAYLQFALHLAWKEIEPDPSTAFLVQLIPTPLIYGIAVLYLIKWRHRLSVLDLSATLAVVLGLIGMELLSGSRGFLLKAGIPLVSYFLIRDGDRRLKARTAAAFGLAGLCGLLLSFALVNSLRGELNVESRVSGAGSAVMEGFREAFAPDKLLYWTSLVTERLNGFDGYAVSLMSRPPELVEVFSLEATVKRVIDNLLPRVQLSEGMSSGKAIGVYYTGHSLDVRHAGALGLFGAMVVSVGRAWSLPLIFLVGILWGRLTGLAAGITDTGFRFLSQYAVLLVIVDCITSGNLDLVISRFVINVAQLTAMFVTLSFLSFVSSRHPPAGGEKHAARGRRKAGKVAISARVTDRQVEGGGGTTPLFSP